MHAKHSFGFGGEVSATNHHPVGTHQRPRQFTLSWMELHDMDPLNNSEKDFRLLSELMLNGRGLS